MISCDASIFGLETQWTGQVCALLSFSPIAIPGIWWDKPLKARLAFF
jgi:hypothetical protein